MIDRSYDNTDLTDTESPIFLLEGADVPEEDVVTTTRIGSPKARTCHGGSTSGHPGFISKR
jgi:hypothetical protein